MIRICSWCEQEGKPSFLGQAEPLDDPRKTHGVCPTHKTAMLADWRAKATKERN